MSVGYEILWTDTNGRAGDRPSSRKRVVGAVVEGQSRALDFHYDYRTVSRLLEALERLGAVSCDICTISLPGSFPRYSP